MLTAAFQKVLSEGANILSVPCLQERAKAEHRDKLGERDDTIPPEYRHLLDNDEEVSEGRCLGWIYSTKL